MTKSNNEWIEWGKAIVIALIIAIFIRSFLFATSIVEGESMEPTLEHGERVVFNKFVYIFGEPERGDIVIIEKPVKNYVKRIIGLPDETIEIIDGELFINGKKHIQSFLSLDAIQQTGNYGPIVIPDNQYFVMGDNRGISKDSRNGLGLIAKEEIIGKSELIIFPFSEWEFTK